MQDSLDEIPKEDCETVSNEMPGEIASLKILAANALMRGKSNTFFQMYNLQMPLEIGEDYIIPIVDKEINKVTDIYRARLEDRKERVDECSSALMGRGCYRKLSSLTISGLLSGLHVGVYYILKAAGASPSIQLTFICTMPVTLIVGMCLGVGLTYPIAKTIAQAVTPRVSKNYTIDLEELGDNSQNSAPNL